MGLYVIQSPIVRLDVIILGSVLCSMMLVLLGNAEDTEILAVITS